jgi:hypothetical protein
MSLFQALDVPLDAQIAEVEREIAMRERVYKNCVEKKTMTQQLADKKLDAMRAVLDTLENLKKEGKQ